MAPAKLVAGSNLSQAASGRDLAGAYRATTYWLNLPSSACTLDTRIGHVDPAIDRLLQALNCKRADLITAHNPYSRPLAAAQNERRDARLLFWLQRFQARVLRGYGVGDDGRWPAEAGWLISGLNAQLACRIATAAGQLAWVGYTHGSAPVLHWTPLAEQPAQT